jgi:hypothetical protein
MSSLERVDMDTLRTRRIVATASLTAVTVAFLLLSYRSTAVSATAHIAAPSLEARATQVAPDPGEAEQTVAVQAPMELEPLALVQTPSQPAPAVPPVDRAEYIAHALTAEPAHLEPSPARNTSPRGSEQRMYKARRALETIDPREFARQNR